MLFSDGVFFTKGGFGGSTSTSRCLIQMCYSDSVQAIVTGEVTPNSFAQQEGFKNRKVHCMRPCRGEALALIFCFPAGTQAPLVFLWLPSNSKIWRMVFSWTDALTQRCMALKGMLMLWKEEEQERAINRGKASVSPLLPPSIVPSPWHLCVQIRTQQDVPVWSCGVQMAWRISGLKGVKRWGLEFGGFFSSMSRTS